MKHILPLFTMRLKIVTRPVLWLGCLMTFFLLSENEAFSTPKVYYVNDGSTAGDVYTTAIGNNAVGNGQSPSSPKLTLTNLLSEYAGVLTSGDTIKIDAGTYHNEENLSISIAGLTFMGAGNSLTVFDDDLAGASTNFFMYIHANDVSVKGMTLREYENNGTQTPGHSGQAITIQNATGILIEDIVFLFNGSSGGNPSISVLSNSTVTIRGGGGFCNVWQTMWTGGIEAFGTNINLSIENYMSAYNFKSGMYDGGGLLISNGNATTVVNVSNSRFFSNYAQQGGAISQRCGVLTVSDCIIEQNFAGHTTDPVYGGAVRITGGTATYTNTRFLNNGNSGSTTLRGAAIGVYSLDANVDLTLNSCYFSGNSGNEGDDLFADKSSSKTINIHATNTTFSGSADALYNKDADHIHLKDCGNPMVAGSNSPAVTKENTTAPSSTPNPNPPGFSGDCVGIISLPVELLSFNGECHENGITLRWITASEINNDYFIIEKSEDGQHYSITGMIDGAGNSNQMLEYTFEDTEPSSSGVYYRLRQVDYDGTLYECPVIYISPSCHNTGAEIVDAYFEHDAGALIIQSGKALSSPAQMVLTDITGRVVAESDLIPDNAENRIPLPRLDAAVYLIFIRAQNFSFMKKIFIY